MKVFISQSMNGRTYDEIIEERNHVISEFRKMNPDAKIIDSFFESVPTDATSLWYLSKCRELLSIADLAIFVNDCCETSRGCKIEYLYCKKYGINTIKFIVTIKKPGGIFNGKC